MYKLLILLFVSCLAACNNASTPAATAPDAVTKPTVQRHTDSVEREGEMNFIDGCVENAKLTLGEAKAYTFCKCIYAQAKTKYPNMDSAAMTALSDTAEIAKMAANCR